MRGVPARCGTPRGMAIVGDTLWVADRTMLRAFGRSSGRPIATVALGPLGAQSLSDIAVGLDGALYVSDAAVTYSARGVAQRAGTPRIYRVVGRKPSVALEHARLDQPTGLSWDPINARLLIGSAANDTILGWRPGQPAPETVAVPPGGPWDGVEAIGGTAFYVLSSARGEILFYQSGALRRMVQGARGAGDMAIDPRAGRLVVPIPGERRVEVWEIRR